MGIGYSRVRGGVNEQPEREERKEVTVGHSHLSNI